MSDMSVLQLLMWCAMEEKGPATFNVEALQGPGGLEGRSKEQLATTEEHEYGRRASSKKGWFEVLIRLVCTVDL